MRRSPSAKSSGVLCTASRGGCGQSVGAQPGAPVRTLDNAAQVHPVVARLCAPIEGTDAARLADCLGLDAARFHAAAAAAAGAGARGAADDALLGAAASLDDDARYSVRGRRQKTSLYVVIVSCAGVRSARPCRVFKVRHGPTRCPSGMPLGEHSTLTRLPRRVTN